MYHALLPFTTVLALALQPGDALPAEQLVTQHGAVADDEKLDTQEIQAAIDAAAAAGGGIVRFSSGTFLSGGLQLRSKVTLQLDEGAVLQGSEDHRDYGEGRWSKALIQGENVEGIRICGKGTIDGAELQESQWRGRVPRSPWNSAHRLPRHRDLWCDSETNRQLRHSVPQVSRRAAPERDNPWRARWSACSGVSEVRGARLRFPNR